jgi:hypothetical protein
VYKRGDVFVNNWGEYWILGDGCIGGLPEVEALLMDLHGLRKILIEQKEKE